MTTKKHFGTIIWAIGTGGLRRATAAQQRVWPSGSWPGIPGNGFGAVQEAGRKMLTVPSENVPIKVGDTDIADEGKSKRFLTPVRYQY